ncbi:hypothetical protein BS47DRAFT_1353472 [Hydnum rufescens UP504]|uniref:Glucose receptor Git3 N-terminal domain-containing protein n=1 Tax=Hydnum rufescens UP504 TaxID=1448309 RepID=A0A9P6DLI7_9AGAM|nr:hypothetical protein BS47DRAFT_1353472 [Hydnum rufescens UP504]
MDSIQAMANILSARWAFRWESVLKQIGDDGVSWFTIAIAVMTFVQTMFPGKLNLSQARQLAAAMIVFIFLFLSLIIIIPATTISHYYGNTGAWCWITDTSGDASRLKIGSEYGYFWLTAIVTFVLYGTIVVNWLREATVKGDRHRHREAVSMIWYYPSGQPIIFPISVVRFLQWKPKGPGVQHGFIILAVLFSASSGAVNVLLWVLTGRRFGFSDPREGDEEEGRRWGPYMTHTLSYVSGGMHSPAATTVGGPSVSHPSFPEDPPLGHRAYVPGPYVWMPPGKGTLP